MRSGALVAAVCLGAMAAAVSCDGGTRSVAIEDAAAEITDLYCARMFACDCENGRRFESEVLCEDSVYNQIDQLRDEGRLNGLTYDPYCIGGWLDGIDDRGCGPDSGSSEGCIRRCSPFHGSKGIDAQCDNFGNGVSDCAQGLQCSGVCVDPCGEVDDVAQLGEACVQRQCAEDLACGENQRCVERAAPGESCAMLPCRDGAFCETIDPMDPTTRECTKVRDHGEACSGHDQCESGYCPNGFCGSVPGKGDRCEAGVCGSGLQCLEETCVTAPPAICYENMPF